MRKHTKTSTFGVSGRTNHDASRYYERALMKVEITDDETVNPFPEALTNQFICADSRDMSAIPDSSVALMVTSPSYHVGKDYDTDDSFETYLSMLERVFTETYRVLEPGGRAAINVANLGRKPYVLLSDLVAEMCMDIGFVPRGEIIWIKAKGANGSIAVGSYMSPANPVLRDLHEYILVFSKGRFDRAPNRAKRAQLGLPCTPTITKEDFFASSLSVWDIPPESARRIGHPAPFPVELPRRLVQFFTYKDDVVLDPFMGAGATAVAATMGERRFVGFDLDDSYLDIARRRVALEVERLAEREEVPA